MRILWVCNIMPPIIGQCMKKECSVKEGWISGSLLRLAKTKEPIELGICYPVGSLAEEAGCSVILADNKEVSCYGFYENTEQPHVYGGDALERRMEAIIRDFKPQLLHIFGTEYGHSLAAARAFRNPARTLVGIQGVISECAREYMADLPLKVRQEKTFRDRLKKDGLMAQQQKFMLRGELEQEVLRMAGNVTGRTAFDRKAAESIHPGVRYYFMNETLRSEFYEGSWKAESCRKHSIFFSQADYPLKGFHYLLQALAYMKEQYPDITVFVAGNSLVNYKTMKDKIKISAYGRYLLGLIRELDMEDRITFLGKLSAEEMKQQYLSCHTFVCASSLENSPNSVGEAMLLGTPVVAPYTGGIPSMLTHEEEGLLFEKGNPKALADAIMRIWREPASAAKLSLKARMRARQTHNADTNFEALLNMYHSIIENKTV